MVDGRELAPSPQMDEGPSANAVVIPEYFMTDIWRKCADVFGTAENNTADSHTCGWRKGDES